MKATAAVLEKIANAAIENMTRRANIELTGTYEAKVVSAADLWAAIAAEPTGNVAFRFAELFTLGIEHYEALA